jgi:hypothetical protein
VFRRHAIPLHCRRCKKTFEGEIADAESALYAHSEAPTPCEIAKGEVKEGYNKEQESQLRCRKRPLGQTDVDRWRDMYRILFLRGGDGPTPSPC